MHYIKSPHVLYLTAVSVISALPNQELSGAKSELQGETVGLSSFYRRVGQLPDNLPAAHLRFIRIFPPSHYRQQYHFRPTVGLQENFPRPNYKH